MLINPSLICFDHINILETTKFLEAQGFKRFHIDVMDDHRVPRMGIYPEIVQSLENYNGEFEFDIHLMVEDVIGNIERWGKYIAGITRAYFHLDHARPNNTLEAIELCNALAIRPGIVFDLADDTDIILRKFNKLASIDLDIMFMGILPGVLQQEDHSNMLLAKMEDLKPSYRIGEVQIDGGVNFATIPELKRLGATTAVCGSSTIFKGVDFQAETWKNDIMVNLLTMEALGCTTQ